MSAYRTAPAIAAPSFTLTCAVCGAPTDVARLDDTFWCARCGREQPALRGDVDLTPASLHATSYLAGNYEQLVPFAKAFGIEARCASVTLACDGIACKVSLGIQSGVVTGAWVSAHAPEFPTIRFRRERPADVEGKRRGVAHEVQTGDPGFDASVYIESDHADDDVAPVVASPAVRLAIRRLLKHAEAVLLDPSGPQVHVEKSNDVTFSPDDLRERIAAVRVLAGAPRARAVRPASTDVWGIAAAGGILGALVLGPILAAVAWSCCRPATTRALVTGLGASLPVALALQPLVTRKLRGRWDSHVTRPVARLAVGLLVPAIVIPALVFVNAIFDRSPEQTYDLVVESVDYDSEDDSATVTARGRSGEAARLEEQQIAFGDPGHVVAAGQRVTLGLKRGALGWAWRSSPARLYAGQGVLQEK